MKGEQTLREKEETKKKKQFVKFHVNSSKRKKKLQTMVK